VEKAWTRAQLTMNRGMRLFLSAACAFLVSEAMFGQGADEQTLLHPPANSWPIYHGDYSGRRYSALTQITPENVKNLTLAWAFQTNQFSEIKSSPLLVDGILYFTVPENIVSVKPSASSQRSKLVSPHLHYLNLAGVGDHPLQSRVTGEYSGTD